MNITYQVGLDIATALSVIIAAWSITLSNRKQKAQDREKVRESNLLESLKMLECLIREVRTFTLITTKKFEIDEKFEMKTLEVLEPFFKSYTETTVLIKCSFAVWANDVQREMVIKLNKDVAELHNLAVDLIRRRENPGKAFEALTETLENCYEKLGESLVQNASK